MSSTEQHRQLSIRQKRIIHKLQVETVNLIEQLKNCKIVQQNLANELQIKDDLILYMKQPKKWYQFWK